MGKKVEFLIASRAPLLEHRSCHDWWKSDLGKQCRYNDKLYFTFFVFRRCERRSHLPVVYLWSSFFYTFHTLENDVFNFASYFQGGSSLQSVFIKRWWQSLTNGISPLRCGSVLFFKFGIIRLPAIFTCCILTNNAYYYKTLRRPSENLSKSARLPEL